MSSAIAFASEGALPAEFAAPPTGGFGDLLDAVVSPGLDLPCRSGDADLWFAEAPADLERAKRLCADCPIRESCLAGALDRREPWGVWGGEIFERGVIVARKRPRGRPRKHPVAERPAEQPLERANSSERRSAAA
ncbi:MULTISPECIES: WhiB family transcriptional regulator [Amycolatopsis]|uniref:Transcriptional regulator WhiB n=2 Tax=Amycolatopsis TaxID=1813 RepID=A0A1I3URI1_9PSEU|nr:WhiB family transcriptional regulator [Amycolatopsis sacchari]SFJ85353.1 WhiB family transcriptional regulator, redox-sensing transcriptional regulator [Amycolatopsis sacchari]